MLEGLQRPAVRLTAAGQNRENPEEGSPRLLCWQQIPVKDTALRCNSRKDMSIRRLSQ